MAYWWCLDHKAVEGDGGCRADVRLGPYPDEASASRAVQSVQEREQRLDGEDEEWDSRG